MAATVADFMTPDPLTVRPETSLTEAIKLLVERHISGLPVVDEQGRLVGVVSEGDLMWRESGVQTPPYLMLLDSVIFLENPLKYERDLHKALGESVKDVMTKKPITIPPDQSLPEAAHLLTERQVHRLIVVDTDQKVVGVLTRGDVVRALAQGA
jgi:CBS domain-containing protein